MLHHDQPVTGTQEPALKFGRNTNRRTRPLFLNGLRADMAHGSITVYSPVCYEEMTTFIEHEDGKLAAQEGCHDDTVIALALANSKIQRAQLVAVQKRRQGEKRIINNDPFRFDNILKNIKRGQFPIRPQHAFGIQNLNAKGK